MFDTDALVKHLESDVGRTKQPNHSSSTTHWAVWMLQNNIVKKFTDSAISKTAEKAALDKFHAVNKRNLEWTAPVNSDLDENHVDKIIERARSLCASQYRVACGRDPISQMSMAHAFNIGMVGPGMARDATSDYFADKLFNSTLTATHPILFSYYKQAIANMKPWRKAEAFRSRLHGEFSIVEGNKLFFVPKETVIARTAATEPTLNMFGQLGYGSLIESKLLVNHDIDLSIQPNINKWFARSGSINGTFATIDLSSASDTIGMRFCEWLLPDRMFKDLSLLRSPKTTIQGRDHELYLMSTMGNGFTFPLQTWIFANLVLATMIRLDEPIFDEYGKRRYSVFGDDIICPSKVYDTVVAVLERAGFTVNKKKSFATGGFRESCGGDYFKGVNIRAVYMKEYTGDASIYSLINRLMDWSICHGIYLPKTMSYLRTLVKFRPIPQYEDERSGIRTPLSRLSHRKVTKDGNFIYYALKQKQYKVTPEGRTVEKFYHAFHVSFLHGSFSWGRVLPRVRAGEEVFKVVKTFAPISWDFVLEIGRAHV